MKKVFLLVAFWVISCAPIRYIAKDSEPLSKAAYATSDSIDKGRIDLADQYAKAVITLVVPPKERIEIKPLTSKPKPNEVGKNVLVIPKHLQGLQVIVVDSTEYQQLLTIKENAAQVQVELNTLKESKLEVEAQLREQKDAKSQLLMDYDKLVLELKDKQLALLRRNVIISGMILFAGVYVFARVRGLLPF